MSKIFNVGFCGAGGIVRGNHLPELESRPGKFKVVGFYDVKKENAEKLAGSKYKVYSKYDDMLGDSNIRIVVIATRPLDTHYPLAKQALDAGKDVVLEKPMASTSSECDDLIKTAREKKLILTVHHNRRLDLDFLSLQEIIRQGKVGQPRLIENNVISGSYEKGDIVDWGVHLVDQCLLLNKSPLTEVSAVLCSPENGIGNCGYGAAVLRFKKLPVVHFKMLPRTKEYLLNGTNAVARFYVAGTKGSFSQRVIEDPRDLMNATMNWDNASPDYAVPPYLDIKVMRYYDYLYESLANGKSLLVRPEEARNAIRVLELIEQSARENRTVKAEGMIEVN